MLVLLALLALQAPLERAPAGSDAVSLCQTTAIRVDGQNFAWVNLMLDGDGRQVDNQLYMSGDNFEAAWTLGPRLLAGRQAMTEFSASIKVPANTAFPATLKAFVGNRLLWSRRVAERTDRLFISQGNDNPVPNLRGVRQLQLVAEDAAGAVVARRRLEFPDWGRLERGTARAMRHNERLARGEVEGDGCGPAGPIV